MAPSWHIKERILSFRSGKFRELCHKPREKTGKRGQEKGVRSLFPLEMLGRHDRNKEKRDLTPFSL
jgi:hypothetical protein